MSEGLRARSREQARVEWLALINDFRNAVINSLK